MSCLTSEASYLSFSAAAASSSSELSSLVVVLAARPRPRGVAFVAGGNSSSLLLFSLFTSGTCLWRPRTCVFLGVAWTSSRPRPRKRCLSLQAAAFSLNGLDHAMLTSVPPPVGLNCPLIQQLSLGDFVLAQSSCPLAFFLFLVFIDRFWGFLLVTTSHAVFFCPHHMRVMDSIWLLNFNS